MALVDYFRLAGTFDRLGRFGIAVRGRAHSALLYARRPLRQLDGAVIAVTEETSTTLCLLRLLLEVRYRLTPAAYERVRAPHTQALGVGWTTRVPEHGSATAERGHSPEADALLLIGDEALRFQQANTRYPFEIDVAFEWWLWQHLPFVFAVWAVRKDVDEPTRKQLERGITTSLGLNMKRLDVIAQESAKRLGLPETTVQTYLSSFIYRLSQPEEEAISRFRELAHANHLL